MSSVSSGVTFWDVPSASDASSGLRQVGRIPAFHMSQAAPLSLCVAEPCSSGVEVLAIGTRATRDVVNVLRQVFSS